MEIIGAATLGYLAVGAYKWCITIPTIWVAAGVYHNEVPESNYWRMFFLYFALVTLYCFFLWPIALVMERFKFFAPYSPDEVREIVYMAIKD